MWWFESRKLNHDFILKCKQENKAIVFSSHNMYETEKLCDRVIIIHKGKIVASGTIEQLKKEYQQDNLEDLFIECIRGNDHENIMTIVKKEFKDILRDRKTLLMTFVIPIIVMPLLFTFIFSSIGDMASPSEDNKYKIVLETNNPEITALFKEAGIYELVNSKDPINEAYDGKIVAYIIANDINESLTQGSTSEVDLYYDTTSNVQ